MSNANKAKGTRWESTVKNGANAFFQLREGLKAYRPAQEGFRDVGDIHGVSPFIWQAKDWKDVTSALREGLAGAVLQAQHAGETYGAAIVKRARRSVGEAYAVTTFADHCRLLLRLRRAEALLRQYAPTAYDHHKRETAAETAEDFPRAA